LCGGAPRRPRMTVSTGSRELRPFCENTAGNWDRNQGNSAIRKTHPGLVFRGEAGGGGNGPFQLNKEHGLIT